MSLVQAELQLESAFEIAPIAHRRMVGSEAFVLAYQGAGLLAGIFLGTLIVITVPIAFIWGGWLVPTWLPVQAAQLILAIVGWGAGLSLAQRRHRQKFVAGIRRRGTPDRVMAGYTVTDAGLCITTERVQYRIAWEAILEIVPSPDTWLLQVDATTFLVPHDAFADEADQRAFLGEILARIRPEARARSAEALAFANQGALV
jgi:YcxB-like protein